MEHVLTLESALRNRKAKFPAKTREILGSRMVHFMVAVVTISAIFVGYIALLVFMIVKCCRGLMSAETDEFSEDSNDEEADLGGENKQVHPAPKSENQGNENGHQKVEQAKETQEQ